MPIDKEEASRGQKIFFLILTMLAGIIACAPLLNFQYFISTGDHGRDLYAFQQTLNGALPYQDYSWLYGPLMPYYYGFFMLIGGIAIQSVLLGQFLLIVLTGVFIYAACALHLSPIMSLICALWYWAFRGAEFFYTYNHIGALCSIAAAFFFLLGYIKKREGIYIWLGLLSIFTLFLIRLNMGAFVLIAFILSALFSDALDNNSKLGDNARAYLLGSLSVICLTALIYWLFLFPLEDYALKQSLPYGKFQRTDSTSSLFESLLLSFNIAKSYFLATPAQIALGCLLILSAIQCLKILFSKSTAIDIKKQMVLTFVPLILFIAAVSHEFLASGTFFRIAWILPIFIMAGFQLISAATRNIRSPAISFLLFTSLLLPPIWNIAVDHHKIRAFKNPHHMLKVGKNKIYTSQDPYWLRTVLDASHFIEEYIPETDAILALPFDPLYLFLANRDSITRQLVFFDHINIEERQERKIIDQMESKNGNWVLISSRSVSNEPGMGTFGKTYGIALSDYISKNFIPVAEFGDMQTPGGWGRNHGVRFLKRK